MTYNSNYIKIYDTRKYRSFFYNIPITKGVKNMVNKEKDKPKSSKEKPGKEESSKEKPGKEESSKEKPPMRDPIMKRG